jgi:hypothetical protein
MLTAGTDRHAEEGNTNPTLPYTTKQESQRNLVGSEKNEEGEEALSFSVLEKLLTQEQAAKLHLFSFMKHQEGPS